MEGLFANLMRVTLNMSALAALTLLCTPLLKKRYSANWRYWVWMVIAIRLLIPFQMPAIELPDLKEPFQAALSSAWPEQKNQKLPAALEEGNQAYREENIPQNLSEKQNNIIVGSSAPNKAVEGAAESLQLDWKTKLRDFPWQKTGLIIWALGAVVVLAARLASYQRMRRVLRAYARPIEDPACRTVWEEIKKEQGYRGPLRLMRCSAVSSPMVCGLFRPLLLLPCQKYSNLTLQMIFRHELVHIMRHDLWYKLLLLAASTVHWFNPIVHWLVRAADRDLEISCDEKVTCRKNRDFRAQYSEAIFAVLQQGVGRHFLFTTSFCNEKKTLMQRFSAIFDTNRKHRGVVAMSMVLVVCLLTGSLIGCQASPEKQSSLPENLTSPVLSVGDTAVDVKEEALAQMDWTALLYEEYAFGHDLDEFQAPEADTSMGFGYLKEKERLEPYLDATSQAYGIKANLLIEIRNFFISSPSELVQEDEINWFAGEGWGIDRLGFTLEPSSVRQETDGDIIIDYRRIADKALLRPVRYVFRPVQVELVPEALKEDFSEGDIVYQVVSVQNLNMEQLPQRQAIEISNAQELLQAAERINAGGWLNQYDTYILTADIDLSDVSFTPMGQNERYLGHWDDDDARDPTLRGFNGVFDGQGHTIFGLRLAAEGQDYLMNSDYAVDGIGLFSLIGTEGVVKNLNLKDCVVTSPCRYDAEYGSAGLLAGSCNGTLESVSVEGTVEGGCEVGGVAGQIGGNANSCTASVTVSGYGEVGAFAGSFCYGVLEDCTASGQVRAVPAQDAAAYDGLPTAIGGFIGFSVQGTVINCESSVYISTMVSSNWVGAFAGYVQSFRAENCIYDEQKAPGWEVVDVVYNTSPGDRQDIRAA